jgi:hypothetical protein
VPRPVLMAANPAGGHDDAAGEGSGGWGGEGGGGEARGKGDGAIAVALGSSHSLALVGRAEYARQPAAGSNATGMERNWWPCLRDMLELARGDGAEGTAEPACHELEASGASGEFIPVGTCARFVHVQVE